MVQFQIMKIFIHLVVGCTLVYVIICPLNFLHVAFLVFSYVIVHLTKYFVVLTLQLPGIYITRHAQFDETHFPFLSTSLAQPILSLEFSHFLEPYHTPTNTIKSSNMSHSQHITQSESNSYGICTDLVNESILENDSVIVNMSLQENDSVTGPSLLNLTSISLEEPNPAPATATSISSHSMLTRAKMVFIKLVIQQILLY